MRPSTPTLLSSTDRSRLTLEVVIVLALSLGASAVYALVRILERVTRDVALSEQTATINQSLSARPGFDLTFQLLSFVFGLAPVALVLWLTWRADRPRFQAIGLVPGVGGPVTRWIRQGGAGFALAACIGIPGLVFYVVMRIVGWNVNVVATALDTFWWTVPVLVLQALKAALLEEIIVVGYLFHRLKQLGWGVWTIILSSALLRGTYHLYQGFGGFIGNVIMGLVFGWAYQRWGRIMPLIIAHWLLDIVSFVGYPLAAAWFPEWFASSD